MKWFRLLITLLAGAVITGVATFCTKPVADRVRSELVEPPAPITIQFSGYEWVLKTSQGQVGPGANYFGPEGVRVDEQGNLHLTIVQKQGRWICPEIILKRSFGFGEYRWVVRETANLDLNAVLGLFLWDTNAFRQHYREIDFIEVGRWGTQKPNAQFVVQPYGRPGNLVRFELPPGRVEISSVWRSGQLLCRATAAGRTVRQHLFTEGIPEPGTENVRANVWLFRSPPRDGKDVEVIIESFKFLPLTKRR